MPQTRSRRVLRLESWQCGCRRCVQTSTSTYDSWGLRSTARCGQSVASCSISRSCPLCVSLLCPWLGCHCLDVHRRRACFAPLICGRSHSLWSSVLAVLGRIRYGRSCSLAVVAMLGRRLLMTMSHSSVCGVSNCTPCRCRFCLTTGLCPVVVPFVRRCGTVSHQRSWLSPAPHHRDRGHLALHPPRRRLRQAAGCHLVRGQPPRWRLRPHWVLGSRVPSTMSSVISRPSHTLSLGPKKLLDSRLMAPGPVCSCPSCHGRRRSA